jgi:hypothetical protein
MKNKKAAIELSIGTIVVIVIAMSMLILGLVLVRTIFTGSIYNVEQLNKNVEEEINKLFEERGGRTYIYLPNNQADIKKGDAHGIAFAIKNIIEGESESSRFTYNIKATSIQKGCELTLAQADNYLILGDKGNLDISPGSEPESRLVRFQAPENAPLCEIQYDLIVKEDGQTYDTNFFIIKIK